LKYSLEQRLNELPKNHPKSSIIIEELSLVASPTLSPRQSMISTQNQYSTLSKPAALTGMQHISLFLWSVLSTADPTLVIGGEGVYRFFFKFHKIHIIKFIVITILQYGRGS
jgi:hypothetical protein